MDQIDHYRLEVQNVSRELVMLTCPTKAPVMLLAADNGREPARLALTAEQFLSMAYDLEGFVDGTHGVKKQLALYAVEVTTGREERVPFELGRMVATGGFSADVDAAEKQAEQEAEIDAKREAALKLAAENPNTDTLGGAVQASLNAL